MKSSKINRIKDLHNRVIHEQSSTEEDYLLENKEIGKLADAVLVLVCAKCFPLSQQGLAGLDVRPSFKYDIRYPRITKVVKDGVGC